MGAEFVTRTIKSIKQKEIKEFFEREQEDDLYENGHSYSGGLGMAEGIEFRDETFDNVADAYDWLADNAKKWEAALAVQAKSKTGEIVTVIGAWCSS